MKWVHFPLHPETPAEGQSLEPEIAVLLKDRLEGPGIGALDALRAVAGYLPAVEIPR